MVVAYSVNVDRLVRVDRHDDRADKRVDRVVLVTLLEVLEEGLLLTAAYKEKKRVSHKKRRGGWSCLVDRLEQDKVVDALLLAHDLGLQHCHALFPASAFFFFAGESAQLEAGKKTPVPLVSHE